MSSTMDLEVPNLDITAEDEIVWEDQFIGVKDPLPGALVVNPPGVVFVVTGEESSFSADTYSQQQSTDFEGFTDIVNVQNCSESATTTLYQGSANANTDYTRSTSFQGYVDNSWLEENQSLSGLLHQHPKSLETRASIDDFLNLIAESTTEGEDLKTPADILQEIYLEANELEEMNSNQRSSPEIESDSNLEEQIEEILSGSATPNSCTESSYESEMLDSVDSDENYDQMVINGIEIGQIPADQLKVSDGFVLEMSPVILQGLDGKFHQITVKSSKVKSSGGVTIRPSPTLKRAGRWRGPGGSMLDAKERKKLQNREAAARYRVKKQQEKYVVSDVLEQEEARNKELKKQVGELSHEIAYLKDLMSQIKKRQK